MFSYQDIDFVSDAFFKDILTEDGDIASNSKPKKKTATFEINGKSYTIVLDIRAQLTNLLTDKGDNLSEYKKIVAGRGKGFFFEPIEAVKCFK